VGVQVRMRPLNPRLVVLDLYLEGRGSLERVALAYRVRFGIVWRLRLRKGTARSIAPGDFLWLAQVRMQGRTRKVVRQGKVEGDSVCYSTRSYWVSYQ
jgi:hypothetical protein